MKYFLAVFFTFIGLKIMEILALIGAFSIMIYVGLAFSFWTWPLWISWALIGNIIKWTFVTICWGVILLVWLVSNWNWAITITRGLRCKDTRRSKKD